MTKNASRKTTWPIRLTDQERWIRLYGIRYLAADVVSVVKLAEGIKALKTTIAASSVQAVKDAKVKALLRTGVLFP